MDQPVTDHRSLVEAIIALTEEMESDEHIGRYNRLHGRRERMISALLDHESRDAGLALLLGDKDTAIRSIGDFAKGLLEAKGATPGNTVSTRQKLFPFEP